MARPKKDPASVLSARVEARISAGEAEALSELQRRHGVTVASLGIQGGDNFATWLRATIRKEAAAAGIEVAEAAPPAPAPPVKAPKGKPAPKAKGRK